jgi:hypothetical protein
MGRPGSAELGRLATQATSTAFRVCGVRIIGARGAPGDVSKAQAELGFVSRSLRCALRKMEGVLIGR